MHSNAGVRSDLFSRPLTETLLTDFFGSVSEVELQEGIAYEVSESSATMTSLNESRRIVNKKRRRRREEETVTVVKGQSYTSIGVAAIVLLGLQLAAIIYSR